MKNNFLGDPDSMIQACRCPECGHSMPLSEVMAISTGTSLPEDPVIEGNASLRFLPTQFDPHGTPLDPSGSPSPDLACPNCRHELPPLTTIQVPILPGGFPPPSRVSAFRETLDDIQKNVTSGVHSDDLRSRFVALSIRIERCIDTVTTWISQGLISEPRSYSEDLGNLVIMIDDMTAIETGFLAGSLRPDFKQRGTDLNSHYASAATHQDLLDRLRRRCYRGAEAPLHANAIQQLRTTFPRERIWTSQWLAIEGLLTAWIQSHFDEPATLAAGVSLLSTAIIADRHLQDALDQAKSPISEWRRKKAQKLHWELVLKLINAHDREDLASAIEIKAELEILPPDVNSTIEPETMARFAAAQTWLCETQAFDDATQYVCEASESVRQLLDESAHPSKIETLFDRLRKRAMDHGIEVDPGLVHRVRTRLQEERKARVFKRRLTVMISLGVIIVAAGVFGMRFEIKRRVDISANLVLQVEKMIPLWVNDDSLRLDPSSLSTRDEAIATLRPSDAEKIIDRKLEDHSWLAGKPEVEVMKQRCVLTKDLQKTLFKRTRADLQGLVARLNSDEIGPTVAARDFEIPSLVAVASDRMDLSDLAATVKELIATSNARSLETKKVQFARALELLIDRLKVAEGQWPGDDDQRRITASAWRAASLVWQGLGVDTALYLAALKSAGLSETGTAEEIRITADERFGKAVELASRNQSLEMNLLSLVEPIRLELELTQKLKTIVEEFGDLLAERDLLGPMEESFRAATIMNATQDWRRNVWPDLKMVRSDPTGAKATTAAQTRELQAKIESHLERFPFSPLEENAQILQDTLARGTAVTTSDLRIAEQELAKWNLENLVEFNANSGKVLARNTGNGKPRDMLVLYKDDLYKAIDQLNGVLPQDPKLAIAGKSKPSVPILVVTNTKRRIQNASGYRLSMALLNATMELREEPNIGGRSNSDALLRLVMLHLITDVWIETCGGTFPEIAKKLSWWRSRIGNTLLSRDWPRSLWDLTSEYSTWRMEAEAAVSRFPLLQPMIDTALANRRQELDTGSPVVPVGLLGPAHENGRAIKWIGDRRPEGILLIPTRSGRRSWILKPLEVNGDGSVTPNDNTPRGVAMIYLKDQDV